MIFSRFNRIIVIFALITFAFTRIAQATFSISLPQIMASGCPANPTGTSSSHLRSFLSTNSSTTTWTSASSIYTQILPGCCFRSNGIPGSCETQSTCKLQTGTPAASATVPTPSPTVSATPNHSPSPSHSSGRRSMELDTSLMRSLALLGLISMAMSYLVF
ncbi:uncharacterized protein EAE97_011444 [Botrytis byssoidea]|uniref:Uncharacterized protein n=1 Tax=Botrytis byssoidea TaxID=139641 RepID=A0A9P5LKI3_9HELO|nr:uncharacterized protein EAE97_011444 [Botrytis byssoidea]KAF7920551.1 hypothetical protein EAE97_011444 [Botrytis byssoidea]